MARVAIVMGSESDLEHVEPASALLSEFGISAEVRVLSAHRTPEALREFVRSTDSEVFIAAAGGAAHLAGVIAALTPRPVLAVPIPSPLLGIDSLLSMVQMPGGVPVAVFAVGRAGAKNAALFAVQIFSCGDAALRMKLTEYREAMAKRVLDQDASVRAGHPNG